MSISGTFSRTGAALAAAVLLLAASVVATGPAAIAADITDIGYVDQGQLSALPQFQRANRELNDYGANLQKQYVNRARKASSAEQQHLSQEFQAKMADKQRQLLQPLFTKAQVAIASVASSKNLSVVIDKRIVIVGGQDITSNVRDLLNGVADPVPPVSTPPPSTVGYVDQSQVDAVPKVKAATDEFAKFKADEDRATAEKLKGAKTDADRNKLLQEYQKTLEAKQNQLIKPWVDKTRDAMSSVAKKRGLTLVVDRGNVIYGGTDITSDVTSALK